jgi:hypothetical protein
MAKLSDTKRANILAKWNTGQYTKTAIAKQYKVTEKVIREIVGKEKPTNTDFVEAQLSLEKLKKSEKSPNEIKAIDQAVEYRLKKEFSDDNKRIKIYDTADKILDRLNESLEKNTKQIVMKVKEYSPDGGTSESLDTVNVELNTTDYKNMADAVDKISVTQNVNDRHAPKGDVNVQANQVNETIIEIQ